MRRQKLINQNAKAGFTMIELLVVIVILGLLSVVGLGSFMSSQAKSRDSRRKSDLTQIAKALEMYYNDKGEYPASDYGKIAVRNEAATDTIDWGESFVDAEHSDTIYMTKLPKDTNGRQYYYVQINGGSGYALYALLENAQDRDAKNGGYALTFCPGTCNYGISSSNVNLN